MIENVERVNELRAELDFILEGCDLAELSSARIVEKARKIEELLIHNN